VHLVNCLRRLRENVKNLHAKYLGNETCRLMLLQPINSSEDYCRGLKLNAYVTDPRHYQICENSPKCWVHSRIKSVDVMDSWINRFCWEMRMSTLVNYVQDDLMFVILLSYHNLHKWVLYTGDPWNKKMLAQQSESLWMLPSLRFLICFCWLLVFVNYFSLIISTFLNCFFILILDLLK